MEYERDNDPFTERVSEENKQRIKMPFGAIAACILVLGLVIGALTIGVKYAKKYVSRISERLAQNEVTETVAPVDDGSKVPVNTVLPNANEIGTGSSVNPSSGLQFASSTTPADKESQIIQHCMDSVVSIDVMVRSGYSTVPASGSGVIISKDGYIATCNHVVEGANKIYVYLNDGTSAEARLIGRDVINDLAVIKIEATDLTYAVFGDSSTLRVGEDVFAIGNALGVLSNTYTKGCISGLDRVLQIDEQEMTLLQTDAAINHGNSGGGLFRKSDGTLIGIVNAKSAGESIEGLGFAIPSVVVSNIVSDLMDYGFVTGRAYLGVSTEDVTLSGYGFFTSYYTYPKIVSIEENSPAAASELQAGDIILSIDGTSISGTDSLVRTLNSYKIGDTVTISVLRDRQSIDIQITLGERSVD